MTQQRGQNYLANVERLLKERAGRGSGLTRKEHTQFRNGFVKLAKTDPEIFRLYQRDDFAGYLGNMGLTLARLKFSIQALRRNPKLRSAVLGYIQNEYRTLKEIGVPPSTIRDRAHLFTSEQAAEVYEEAENFFPKHLVRTAAQKAFKLGWENTKELKEGLLRLQGQYSDAKRIADAVFGDPDSMHLSGKIAQDLFTAGRKRKNELERRAKLLKNRYDLCFKASEAALGGARRRHLRTAATILFRQKTKKDQMLRRARELKKSWGL